MNQSTPPTRTDISRKRIIVIGSVLLLVMIGIAGYAYYQQQNNARDNSAVLKDSDAGKVDVTDNIEKITTELPNGKTAVYDNTESNRKIIFAESDKGMDYAALSHSDVEDFIKSSDQDIITRLCGSSGERAQTENVVVATMSTSVRMVEYPTEDSCLDELATMRNSDQELRKEAADLIQQVENDVKEFYKMVVIK